MEKFARFVKVLVLIAAVVFIGVALGWLGTGGSTLNLQSEAPPAPPKSPEVTSPPQPAVTPVSQLPSPGGQQEPIASSSPPTPSWENQLTDILDSDAGDTEKASEMVTLFPKLPEDAQAEAARHISNLLPDQNYSLLDQLLTNSNLPDSVLDALMSEAMDRPDALKLPLFLEIARNEMSPKAEDARAFLETFLQQDYGQDWPAWQAGINNWLAQEAPN